MTRIMGVVLGAFSAWAILAGIASAQVPGSRGVPDLEGDAVQRAEGRRVVDVRIVGNEEVSKNAILARLKTRQDREFDPDLVQADAQELLLMKQFRAVRPFIQDTPEGVVVTFEVAEKSRIRKIQYLGNRAITDRVLAKETGLAVGDPLDPYSIRLAQQRIEDFYHRKGYSRTEVTLAEGDDLEEGNLVFLIDEDQIQRVYDVEFVGNQFVRGSRLESFIKSKPGLFAPVYRNRFDRDLLVSDVDRLTAYYRNFGFFNARVNPEVEYDEAHSRVTVRFVIDEGPRYRVRNVSLAGNEIYSTEQLFSLLELRGGQDFDFGKMTSDLNTLKDLYGGNGYIQSQVVEELLFLEEPGQIDLVYKIEEGEQYRVGRINVHIGGEYGITRQSVVLSRLDLRPGDILDISKIRESERRLAASGLFVADPATGQVPRIEIRPRERTASGSDGSTFRGQSPDEGDPTAVELDVYLPPAAEPRPGGFRLW